MVLGRCFFSTINVNGNTIHRQHFATKVATEAWVKRDGRKFT